MEGRGVSFKKYGELSYVSVYKVHISSGDAGYMQGIGVAVATTLFGLLAPRLLLVPEWLLLLSE